MYWSSSLSATPCNYVPDLHRVFKKAAQTRCDSNRRVLRRGVILTPALDQSAWPDMGYVMTFFSHWETLSATPLN